MPRKILIIVLIATLFAALCPSPLSGLGSGLAAVPAA
jgi:hypothetical protein